MNSDRAEQTLFPLHLSQSLDAQTVASAPGWGLTVSVKLVENKCSLRSQPPNTHICPQVHECRFWASSLQTNDVLMPWSSTLMSSLLVLAVVSSSEAATPLCSSVQALTPLPPGLLLFCDFRVCFPGICCWLTISETADTFYCSWAHTVQLCPRGDWTSPESHDSFKQITKLITFT